jgi:hypothetical protein
MYDYTSSPLSLVLNPITAKQVLTYIRNAALVSVHIVTDSQKYGSIATQRPGETLLYPW